MRIAIVQTAFLGDVLLTLPLCAAIRKLIPEAHIVFITTPAAASFVDGLRYADEVVAFDKRGEHRNGKGLRRLIAERCSDIDIALVPHASFRTMRLVHTMRPRHVVTFDNTWTRFLRGAKVVRYPQHLHDADRQLQLLRGINDVYRVSKEDIEALVLYDVSDEASAHEMIKQSIVGTEINPHTEAQAAGNGLPAYIVLAPGTVWPTKQWPLEYVNELSRRLAALNQRVVVVGDSSVHGKIDRHHNIVDVAGRTSLRQAAALIAGAAVVVANDSAPLHVASLQGVPVIGIFGPTVREFGFGPFGAHARIVEQQNLACRPCSNHGTATCPIGTHVCMRSLTPQRVFDVVQDVLAHVATPRFSTF